MSGSSDLEIALEVLDTRLRGCIALHAPAHIFVHAGVVGYDGRAIVIPGVSFSSKAKLRSPRGLGPALLYFFYPVAGCALARPCSCCNPFHSLDLNQMETTLPS